MNPFRWATQHWPELTTEEQIEFLGGVLGDGALIFLMLLILLGVFLASVLTSHNQTANNETGLSTQFVFLTYLSSYTPIGTLLPSISYQACRNHSEKP